MSETNPTARVAPSVRLAWPGDAAHIAAVQRRAWEASDHAAAMAEVDPDQHVEAWQRAILAPPMAHFRVLVAHDGTTTVTGFAAVGPNDDEDAHPLDAEIVEFAIDPGSRGAGHGSRLLSACVDTMRADGYQRARWWLPTRDDDLRAFVTSAGWAPDGAHREVGTSDDGDRLAQVRLHTDITEPA